MSTQTEITRIQTARDKLRAKGVNLGITTSTAKIDAIATAFDGIQNCGAVSATVREGDTYTIPRGYHNGTGTVSGVAGGGNYSLQEKTITPTKAEQAITPDSGYYGLSGVTVSAIPEAYQDVSSVTAGAADVLANKLIVAADGTQVAGTMPNNGAVSKTLDSTTTSYTIPKGYHDGSGAVNIVPESKTVTPTKAAQDVAPSAGKVLTKVTVNAIPDIYQNVSAVTATADKVLAGAVFVDAKGAEVEGTMVDNGAIEMWIDGLTTTSVNLKAGYISGGTVSLTDDIEEALAAI